MKTLATAAAGLLLLLAPAAAARVAAQQVVERTGSGAPSVDERLDDVLAGRYLLVTRDTTFAAADTAPGPVLVLAATLIVEGVVAGDLIAVDSDVYLRPTARIVGDAVNIGGGLYRSEQAVVQGLTIDRPEAPYRIVRGPDALRIEAVPQRRAIELDGLSGFHTPTYDRVDGLGVRWGATYLPPHFGGFQPRIHGQVGYRSERGSWGGELDVALERTGTVIAVGARDVTLTNEGWIRDPLRNSLSFLFTGHDYRDYYGARQLFAELRRRSARGAFAWDARLRAQIEDAKPLRAGDPWTVFDDSIRPNLPADEGRISSLIAAGTGEWAGSLATAAVGIAVELAGAAAAGDFSFGRIDAWTDLAMAALANHGLTLRLHFRGPLPGTGSLPRQRWTFLGGAGTFPAFGIASFRGDRLAFVHTTYIIPLGPRFDIPILGQPDLEAFHVAGMAWTEADRRDLEQNVGLRLRFPFVTARLATDPTDPLDAARLDLGLTLPHARRRPWEPVR